MANMAQTDGRATRTIVNRLLIFFVGTCITFCLRAQTESPAFVAAGSGVRRSMEDKLRDFVNVKDYGAKCDAGVTDDRVAIQNAIDAVGSGTLILPNGPGCGVSAPGIFLYPTNTGITLRGQSSVPPGEYSPAKGGGLISYAKSPPEVLLTNMAEYSRLENIYLDCNNRKSATALMNVLTTYGVQTNVMAEHCSGDGMQIFTEGTPATTMVTAAVAGAKSLTVASITNNRITFGQGFCIYIVVDYGKSNQESLRLSGVEENHLRVPGTTKPHGAGATVRCHGSANGMHFDHYSSFVNGGWGFRIIPGTDNNAIYWNNHSSNANKLGGELWFGSVHKHFGGDYEGDAGPAIQLGLASGREATHFMTIFPPGDVEESTPANNVISVVCDDSSQINTTSETSVVFQTGSNACPTYPGGSSATSYGTFIKGTGPGFWVHTAQGYVEIVPGNHGEIRFLDSSHKLINTVRGDASVPSPGTGTN